jgi:hypothetical protein
VRKELDAKKGGQAMKRALLIGGVTLFLLGGCDAATKRAEQEENDQALKAKARAVEIVKEPPSTFQPHSTLASGIAYKLIVQSQETKERLIRIEADIKEIKATLKGLQEREA